MEIPIQGTKWETIRTSQNCTIYEVTELTFYDMHTYIHTYIVTYHGCIIKKYNVAIWTAIINKTCMIRGMMLPADTKLPIGRSETSLVAGPVRPITTATLAVIPRSAYRNCMFPRMLAHWKGYQYMWQTIWWILKLYNSRIKLTEDEYTLQTLLNYLNTTAHN